MASPCCSGMSAGRSVLGQDHGRVLLVHVLESTRVYRYGGLAMEYTAMDRHTYKHTCAGSQWNDRDCWAALVLAMALVNWPRMFTVCERNINPNSFQIERSK